MQKFTLMMLTCDKYSDIWPAYFGQLRKYWPPRAAPWKKWTRF